MNESKEQLSDFSGQLSVASDHKPLSTDNCQLPTDNFPEDGGIVLMRCDAGGVPEPLRRPGEHWFAGVCWSSPLFRQWLKTAAASAAREGDTQTISGAVEGAPGLWLLLLPIRNRRRITGYDVVVMVTEEFIESEQLAALCQSAVAGGMDLQLCRARLNSAPPASRREIPRLSRLLRSAHDQRRELDTRRAELVSVGGQLAESYEEINLLYTITQNMTVQEPPERFIARACHELLKTLPYAWIGLRLSEDRFRLKRLAGRFFLAGESHKPMSVLRSVTQSLFPGALPGHPMVLDPRHNPKHEPFAALGATVVVQPVVHQNDVVGLLIAGEKRGPDCSATNIDIKLLGAAATHMAIFLENAALYDDLTATFMGTLEALTASIDAKDRYTCGHSRRVAHLTQQLAAATGMDDHGVGRCRIAGLVHDVGKIGVPEGVLLKPGKLTEEEFACIKMHPEIGHRILKDIPQLLDVLPGVLHHHERWDGRGYPHGLKEHGIPHLARLIGLADSFDAMSSTRTYRSALSRDQVLEEIRRCAGAQFDPDLARVFVNLDFTAYDRMTQEFMTANPPMAAAGGAAVESRVSKAA